MTTYDFPPYLVGAVRYDLLRLDLMAPESSGQVGGVQMGFPLWRAEYETVAQSDLEARLWSAWIKRQRGSIETFKAFDPSKVYPYEYMPRAGFDGGFPVGFDGNATSFSLNGDRSEVTLHVPSGIKITTGDHIGFKWASGTKFALVEAMTGGVSSGSPATVTVQVEPAVHPVVPTDSPAAVAYLFRPVCLMKLTPETEEPPLAPEGTAYGKIVAQQVIVP